MRGKQWMAPALLAAALMTLTTGSVRAASLDREAPAAQQGLQEKVRHELVMLPYYTVYDSLNCSVNGDTVTLTGQVTRPTLKSDAEAAVKRIEGVSRVVNDVEVLPLSPWDNQVRRAVYLTLFSSNSPLFRYGMGSDPSIHIIVENGHVTLTGRVSNQADKTIASMYVQQIFGVFSVTNNLAVS